MTSIGVPENCIRPTFTHTCCMRTQTPQIRGQLKQGDKVLDQCHGNWLHHLDWDKGVNNVSLLCCSCSLCCVLLHL